MDVLLTYNGDGTPLTVEAVRASMAQWMLTWSRERCRRQAPAASQIPHRPDFPHRIITIRPLSLRRVGTS
jgi:hypothetical protein